MVNKALALLCVLALAFIALGCAAHVQSVEQSTEEAMMAPVTGVVVPVAKEVKAQAGIAADKVIVGPWQWVKNTSKDVWGETVVPFHSFLLKLMSPKPVER